MASFSFTVPVLRGKPISLGFSIFYQDYQFIGQGFGAITTQNLFGGFSGESLFTQRTKGAAVTLSAPLSYFAKRFRMGRFVRLGLSYSFRTSDILDPAVNRDNDPNNNIPITFRQTGVTQSTLTPTISFNTLNSSLDPTMGQALTLGLSYSGGILGGKVNTIEPTVEYKRFFPLFAGKEARAKIEAGKQTRTFGFRALFATINAFGTPFESNSFSFVGGMPLFARFFLGGDDSIRGYNVRGISPTAPIETTTTTRNIFATDLEGNNLKVRRARQSSGNSIDPSVIAQFLVDNQPTNTTTFPAFLGGDTQLLLNFEYRIPIIGPLQFVPFLDVGSAFNLYTLNDQSERSEFIANQTLGTVALNPSGLQATQREIIKATTPETPAGALPPGFRFANIVGEQAVNRVGLFSQAASGIFDNYRASVGGEFRIQVPVINVPFRLIFAYNPNARADNPFFIEQKKAIRFSVGRTF